MSGIYQNLLNGGNPTVDSRGRTPTTALRDYTHASNIFRAGGSYKLAPKYKFLFHVYFEINSGVHTVPIAADANFSVLVKTIKLPSYTIAQQDLNQYNRKRVVQTKIRYDNIDITWHDDHSNLMRNLWYNYYTYYYGDSINKSEIVNPQSLGSVNNSRNNGAAYDFTTRTGYRDTNPQLANQVWGLYGETQPGSGQQNTEQGVKPPFFKNIYIYGLSQHTATTYVLINPQIVTFSHDTYAYNEGNGVMENRMTLSYEFVKYSEGDIDGTTPASSVPDFANQYYDHNISPNIFRKEDTKYTPGRTQLQDADGGSMKDLSTSGSTAGVNKTSIAYNTFKTQNLEKDSKREIESYNTQAAVSSVAASIRNARFSFPVFGQSGDTVGTAGAETPGTSTPSTIDQPQGMA